MNPIAIGFDIDHTLLIDNKLERVAFLHMLERVIADGGHALGSLAEESIEIDTLLARQRAGEFTIDEAVRRFAAERGIDSPRYGEQYRDLVLSMVDTFVVPAPDAIPTIRELSSRGYRLAILSNGWSPLQQRKAARVDFPGPVLASADLAAQKPDPRAFAALAARLGVEPGGVWYVGDDPRIDVAGAAAAGLQAVWIDAEGVQYPLELPPPAQVIGSLAELLALLPGPLKV